MFGKDLLERVASSFVFGAAGAWGLNVTDVVNAGWKAWLLAGAGAGVLSVVKGLIAKTVGSPNSASLLPGVGPVPPVR